MKNAARADRERYAQLKMLGCLCCRLNDNGLWCGKVECHHLVFNGYRALSGGNQASIPLGIYHHRGQPLMGKTITWMRETFGPSLFNESKQFHERYGTDQMLLALTNELLETQVYS
ncbi:MAG: Ref family protein [Pseudomonadota bacterium]|nr:Ref family protein [Pseudomonadota bacterium]